jgi:hypothetical protein
MRKDKRHVRERDAVEKRPAAKSTDGGRDDAKEKSGSRRPDEGKGRTPDRPEKEVRRGKEKQRKGTPILDRKLRDSPPSKAKPPIGFQGRCILNPTGEVHGPGSSAQRKQA